MHCLSALGFQSYDNRVLFHSLLRVLLLRGIGSGGDCCCSPAKAFGRGCIRVAGGLVFFGLVYVWLTSALWFFETNGVLSSN